MCEWVKDFLRIYTWTEFWMVVSVPTGVMGIWFLFCYLLTIPVTAVRAAAIWSLIFILTVGSATVDAVRKRQSKK